LPLLSSIISSFGETPRIIMTIRRRNGSWFSFRVHVRQARLA
jgi:hypothetical protein